MKRKLAVGLALNRIQFGLGLIFTPQRNARVWVGGAAARRTQTQVLAQAIGARDLVLGIGALASLSDPERARGWFAAHAVADATDCVGVALAGARLPLSSRLFTMAVAGASTVIAATYAASPE